MKQQLKMSLVGLGLVSAVAIGATQGGYQSFAAGSTPAAETAQTDDHAAEKLAAYDSFLNGMAGQLGVDPTEVDAAVRATLLQMVADELAAGHISQDQADELTAMINASDYTPNVMGLIGGHGGPKDGGRGHGGMKGDHDGDHGRGGDDSDATDEPEADATPAAFTITF